MNNARITELAPEEFESASVKNKYIADSRSQYIGFVDSSATDCAEVVSIIEEYDLFGGSHCQAVVFTDRDVSDVTYAGLMTDCDMRIFGIVFDRNLLVKTGCFNNFLEGSNNLEFLCRLSEVTGICCIACSSDGDVIEKTNMVATALAYLLRKYMQGLKKKGCLEAVFSKVTDYMAECGLSEFFNGVMNEFLNNSALYEKIYLDTAPFFVVVGGGICYGVLRDFAEQIGGALADIGQAVVKSDNNDDELIFNTEFKGIIGFQANILGDPKYSWLKGRKCQFWFDHPAFFENMFTGLSDNDYVLCQDEDYADYIRKYYGVKNALQFPPAGSYDGEPDFFDRKLDIVFVGTYYKPQNNDYEYPYQNKIYEYVIDNPDKTIEQAFVELYGMEGKELHTAMTGMFYVRKNIIDYYRHRVVENIIAAGYKLHVYGDSWKSFESRYADNLIIHPQVTVDEAMKVYASAKIGLNVMTWHKSGMTERVANIMLAGAVCLSDKTRYLCENFKKEEIALFDIKRLEELPGQIGRLLEDDTYRQRIARNGRRKALAEHTWKQRALELCAILERN